MKLSKIDFLLLLLLSLLAPLFFYKLGQSSLVSWDEAWYGDISRHIVQTGDLFRLVYNGTPFTDKPPGGFWIEAISFKIFGISEWSARFPQAISGLLTLYLIYLLGRKLFGRVVGFASAVSLASSFWFLYRARSGNLDILLTLAYVLTIYLAFLASEKKKFWIPFILSLAFLPMVKGIVFIFALIPSLVIIFWKSKLYKWTDFLWPTLVTIGLFELWLLQNPGLALWHFTHSLRGSSINNDFQTSFKLYKEYLHNGIGKWFWPGILGVVLGILIKEKRFLVLASFFIFFSIQFLFSQQVHIWHLIPLHPIMILLFYGSTCVILEKLSFWKPAKGGLIESFKFLDPISHFVASRMTGVLISILFIVFAAYFSYHQIRAAWYQFIDIPAYVSDEAILSREAGKYQGKILLDGDFDPAGAFYAGRPVTKLYNPDLNHLFEFQKGFLLITNTWRLEKAKIEPEKYEVIKKDRDKVLIKSDI